MKKMLSLILPTMLLAAFSGGVSAQLEKAEWAPEQHLPDLAVFLELTEIQVEELMALRAELDDQIRPLVEEIVHLRYELHTELAAEEPDAPTLGEILLEIRSRELVIVDLRISQRTDSLNVLDDSQRERLGILRATLVLRVAAHQALELNLIGGPDQEPSDEG